jgi:radical SAM protein with 4Fe4S-binding SPASM domain
VRAATALAAQLGVRVRIPDDMDPQITEPQRLDLARARSNYDLALGADDEARGCCPFPWHFLGLDQDGSVSPCGWWHTGPRLGNLFVDDFASIWQNPAFRRLRQDLVRGVLGHNCQHCPASGMGSARHADSFTARSHDWQQSGDGTRASP